MSLADGPPLARPLLALQMGKWTFVPRDFVHRNPRMKRLTDSGVGTYFPGSKGKK